MLAVDYYFAANTFCHEGASCATVAQSEFGQKYGIFLPTLGLVAYSFFFLTSFWFTRTRLRIFGMSVSTFWNPLAMICCAIGALLFIIVQAIEINAFCWMCMGIDTSAIVMVIPAVLLMMHRDAPKAAPQAVEGDSADADHEGADGAVTADAAAATDASDVAKPASLLHPVLWLAFYLCIAAGPIAWGTRPMSEPAPAPAPAAAAAPAADGAAADGAAAPALADPWAAVPSYIRSFYRPGRVNVVEISSFDCPHCRRLHPELSNVLADYGDHINFTRLTIPLGPQIEACVAYYCAEKQKKETEFADCMFKKPSKDAGQLLEYARMCSIDENSFKSCLVDPASSKAVGEMLENIRSTGFEGAPTIWIEDTQIVGFNEQKGMAPYRDAIEKSPVLKEAFEKDAALKAAVAKNAEADASGASPAEIAFRVTLVAVIAAGVFFLAGIVATARRRKKSA